MSDGVPEYNRAAVRPVECFVEGWRLIQGQYWFFFAVTVVGLLLIGNVVVPFFIVVGPIWCGIEICLLLRMEGRQCTLADLMQGFRYFGASAIPTAIIVVLVIVAIVVVWIAYFGATMSVLFGAIGQGNPPGPAFAAAYGGFTIIYVILMVGAWLVLTAPMVFVYALIVDRQMSGLGALWTCIKAIFANFWGVVGLLLIDTLLVWLGYSLFCVGYIFVLPLNLAASAVAYRQVFPRYTFEDERPDDDAPDDRPPAVRIQSTDIQATAPASRPPETGITSGPPS